MSARIFNSSTYSGSSGTIMPNGDIYDNYGRRKGCITPFGELRDQNDQLIGRIFENGQIRNLVGSSGHLQMKSSGDIQIDHHSVGRIHIPYGMRIPDLYVAYAAAYLINQPTWCWN